MGRCRSRASTRVAMVVFRGVHLRVDANQVCAGFDGATISEQLDRLIRVQSGVYRDFCVSLCALDLGSDQARPLQPASRPRSIVGSRSVRHPSSSCQQSDCVLVFPSRRVHPRLVFPGLRSISLEPCRQDRPRGNRHAAAASCRQVGRRQPYPGAAD